MITNRASFTTVALFSVSLSVCTSIPSEATSAASNSKLSSSPTGITSSRTSKPSPEVVRRRQPWETMVPWLYQMPETWLLMAEPNEDSIVKGKTNSTEPSIPTFRSQIPVSSVMSGLP